MSTPSIPLVQLPPRSIFARYAPQPGGGVAVVSLSGQVLAPSFGALRSRFVFAGSVAGAGRWVVLAPVGPAPVAVSQPSLF